MPAYVRVKQRLPYVAWQAVLTSRLRKALAAPGGLAHQFGPITDVLEGGAVPLPIAGLIKFSDRESALASFRPEASTAIRQERRLVRDAWIHLLHVG